MPFRAGTVLFAHFEGIENMNFRVLHIDLVRQRRDKVGAKLIFAALLRYIGVCAARTSCKNAS